MSQAIQDAVNICQKVFNKASNNASGNTINYIRCERLKAIKEVANNRKATINAVRHSITTALAPNIWSISEFDKLLWKWIFKNDQQIKSDLQQHSKDQQDLKAISNLP